MSGEKRIAVLVSGGGTNLQALIDAQKAGTLHSGEIVLVVSGVEGADGLGSEAFSCFLKRSKSPMVIPFFQLCLLMMTVLASPSARGM